MAVESVNLSGIGEVTKQAASYLPEPATAGTSMFQEIVDVAQNVATKAVGGVSTEATGSFADLIQLQIQAQEEMQTTSMVSNIEKSKHETKMAAIRNIRVS